jgi:hypothetical protein
LPISLLPPKLLELELPTGCDIGINQYNSHSIYLQKEINF